MIKYNKKIIFILLIFMIIFFNSTVEAYTLDEVKSIIEYEEVTSKPDDVDVEFDGTEMIKTLKFSVIQTSIESVLYESNGLTDINFLTTSSTNTNEDWLKVQNVVQNLYKGMIYLSAAALLTLLIYMGVLIVLEGMTENYNDSSKSVKMPRGMRLFRGKNGDVSDELRKRLFVEQWLKSVLLIALITLIINLTIGFAETIASIVSGYQTEEEKVVVYVENATDSTNSSGTINFTFKTGLEGLIMFQTQYDWSKHPARNVLNICVGVVITLFKLGLWLFFVVRMGVIAILVVAAPIVVIVDAFLRINRRRGIFKIWFVFLLYTALLKPMISLIYYVMGGANTTKMAEMPYFILVIIAVVIAAFILSIRVLIRATKQANKAELVSLNRQNEAKPGVYEGSMSEGSIDPDTVKDIIDDMMDKNDDVEGMVDVLDKAASNYNDQEKAYLAKQITQSEKFNSNQLKYMQSNSKKCGQYIEFN